MECSSTTAELLNCNICYSQMERPLQLTCGHTFCAQCMDHLIHDDRNALQVHTPPIMVGTGLGGQYADLRRVADIDYYGGFRNGINPYQQHGFPAQYGSLDGGRPEMYDAFFEENFLGFPTRGVENRRTTIRCPECRQPTKVPATGLPVNYRLQEVIESLKKQKKAENNDDVMCSSCKKGIADSLYFECQQRDCQNSTNGALCPVCAVRNHNGHTLREVRALTASDLEQTIAEIDTRRDAAYTIRDQCVERLQHGLDSFFSGFRECTEQPLSQFTRLRTGLESLQAQTRESLDARISDASVLDERFSALPAFVNNMLQLCEDTLENLRRDFSEERETTREQTVREQLPGDGVETSSNNCLDPNDSLTMNLSGGEEAPGSAVNFTRPGNKRAKTSSSTNQTADMRSSQGLSTSSSLQPVTPHHFCVNGFGVSPTWANTLPQFGRSPNSNHQGSGNHRNRRYARRTAYTGRSPERDRRGPSSQSNSTHMEWRPFTSSPSANRSNGHYAFVASMEHEAAVARSRQSVSAASDFLNLFDRAIYHRTQSQTDASSNVGRSSFHPPLVLEPELSSQTTTTTSGGTEIQPVDNANNRARLDAALRSLDSVSTGQPNVDDVAERIRVSLLSPSRRPLTGAGFLEGSPESSPSKRGRFT